MHGSSPKKKDDANKRVSEDDVRHSKKLHAPIPHSATHGHVVIHHTTHNNGSNSSTKILKPALDNDETLRIVVDMEKINVAENESKNEASSLASDSY